MTQALENPLAPPTAAERRVRGRRRWIGWLAAGIVLVLGVGAAWLATYQPLEQSGGHVGVAAVSAGGQVQTLDNAYGTDWRIVEPEAGDEFEIYFTLHNGGPLAVTIRDIGQQFNPEGTVGSGLRADTTSRGVPRFGFGPDSDLLAESAPVALDPGETVQVGVRFNVLDCATVPSEGVIRSVFTAPVTYSVLGLTHSVDIVLGYAFSIESLPRCPD